MRFNNLFAINKRTIVFIIIGLILLDIVVVKAISYRFTYPELQRLPAYDEVTVKLWIDQIKRCKGFKVVVLGDSVVHGDAVKNTSDTLPAHISKELRELLPDKNISVFNMGVAGASPTEIYFLINALEGAGVNLFIYNINLGWFSRQKPIEHLSLLELKGSLTNEELRSLGEIPVRKRDNPVERWLSRQVLSNWSLYHNRILLNYWLFGKPLREKLEDSKRDLRMLLPFAESPEKIEMRTSWKEKNWHGKLDPANGRVGSLSINSGNKQWLFYQMLIGYIKSRDIKVVFFITPRNHELLRLYDMINTTDYTNNLSIIANAARSDGIPVLDYDNAIICNYFTDTVHLLPEGNMILASKIAHDLIEKDYIMR